MPSAFSARAPALPRLLKPCYVAAARSEQADTSSVYVIMYVMSVYSKAPMRSMSTSFSVRKRQSPRRRFFFVSPANCTRSSFTTR